MYKLVEKKKEEEERISFPFRVEQRKKKEKFQRLLTITVPFMLRYK